MDLLGFCFNLGTSLFSSIPCQIVYVLAVRVNIISWQFFPWAKSEVLNMMLICRYKGRGHFLDPPTVAMCDGVWKLSLPQEIETFNPSPEDLSK